MRRETHARRTKKIRTSAAAVHLSTTVVLRTQPPPLPLNSPPPHFPPYTNDKNAYATPIKAGGGWVRVCVDCGGGSGEGEENLFAVWHTFPTTASALVLGYALTSYKVLFSSLACRSAQVFAFFSLNLDLQRRHVPMHQPPTPLTLSLFDKKTFACFSLHRSSSYYHILLQSPLRTVFGIPPPPPFPLDK